MFSRYLIQSAFHHDGDSKKHFTQIVVKMGTKKNITSIKISMSLSSRINR